MALSGGKFGNGSSTGTSAVTLASIIGSRKQWKQITFTVPANTGIINLSQAATAGATTFQSFPASAAATWTINPGVAGNISAGGHTFELDPSAIYILGTNAADICYVAAIS